MEATEKIVKGFVSMFNNFDEIDIKEYSDKITIRLDFRRKKYQKHKKFMEYFEFILENMGETGLFSFSNYNDTFYFNATSKFTKNEMYDFIFDGENEITAEKVKVFIKSIIN